MLSKGGNKHMRTLNNTEWGGGGRGLTVFLIDKYIYLRYYLFKVRLFKVL